MQVLHKNLHKPAASLSKASFPTTRHLVRPQGHLYVLHDRTGAEHLTSGTKLWCLVAAVFLHGSLMGNGLKLLESLQTEQAQIRLPSRSLNHTRSICDIQGHLRGIKTMQSWEHWEGLRKSSWTKPPTYCRSFFPSRKGKTHPCSLRSSGLTNTSQGHESQGRKLFAGVKLQPGHVWRVRPKLSSKN